MPRLFRMPPKGVILFAATDGDAQTCLRGGTRVTAFEHVANRSIAHHVLDDLANAGVAEIMVVAPSNLLVALGQHLDAYGHARGFKLEYLVQEPPFDIGGALKAAASTVGSSPCIVHLANGLLGEPLAPFLDHPDAGSPDLVLLVHHGARHGEHLSGATKRLLRIAELEPARDALGMAGVLIFGEGALACVAGAQWRDGDDVDLTHAAQRVAAAGGRLQIRLADAWHRYNDDATDLLELNRITLDRLEPELHQARNNGNRIEGRVLIDETALVNLSVIIGPTVIGPGAHISDAYIGPYTSIGSGARIEGTEIERSIISAGASVMHVGGRLVASVVGRDARVFRDFSLPRAMRLRVGDGSEVALC
jgi:glucose-1-phosphate thymidylyltransferase